MRFALIASFALAVACSEPPKTDFGVVVVFDDDPAPVTSDSDADAGDVHQPGKGHE